MPIMKYKTKGNAQPNRKPRVYFTCHPDDFERYFQKIRDDIFKTHDCAIYYTEDMNDPFPDQDIVTDLGSNNLFVVPVTSRLLTQPNRAMDFDIPYAFQENIPLGDARKKVLKKAGEIYRRKWIKKEKKGDFS